MMFNIFTVLYIVIFLAKRGFEMWLDALQLCHLKKRKDKVPKHLEGKVDLETVRKAVSYNIDKLRFGMLSDTSDMVGIWLMIAFGFSLIDRAALRISGNPLISGLAFFCLLAVLSGIVGLPFDLYRQFVIEEKHGFNRQTIVGFFQDKLKGLLIGAITGALLLCLVLLLMQKGGALWWLYAFAGVSLIQLLMIWIYPVLIMPWFNKFTPVPDDLASDVGALAGRVRFPLGRVFSMDGSKRSAHANAFIIGLVGARKIVLFDTLIDKVTRSQLLAVLAHELGHFKLRHLSKRILVLVASSAAMFYGISLLKNIPDVYFAFGFERASDPAAVVIFSLIVTEIAAPFGWWMRYRSRRDERAADCFAVEAVGNGVDLADALIALHKQNLTSPGSHKLYRNYHNSHPALKDRLKTIRTHAASLGLRSE